MPERVRVELTCNGEAQTVHVRPDRLLVDALREDLALTGTKVGCGTGDCGSCTVLLDGEAVNACLVYAAECEGAEVETVEAVAESPVGRVVVDRLVERGGVQCGICTPGFVVAATALLERAERPPTAAELRVALAGNLCRCTGYLPILEAVAAAGEAVRG